MVQRSKNWIKILSVVVASMFITGCNSSLNILKVTAESDKSMTVVDKNGIAYDVDKDTYEYTTPAKKQPITLLVPLDAYSNDYTLEHQELVKYTGSISDAIGYFKQLCSMGYVIETYTYADNSFDAIVCSVDDRIRILYMGGNIVRVFYENKNNSDYFPPYISRERND